LGHFTRIVKIKWIIYVWLAWSSNGLGENARVSNATFQYAKKK
jgi:hypothetical protein